MAEPFPRKLQTEMPTMRDVRACETIHMACGAQCAQHLAASSSQRLRLCAPTIPAICDAAKGAPCTTLAHAPLIVSEQRPPDASAYKLNLYHSTSLSMTHLPPYVFGARCNTKRQELGGECGHKESLCSKRGSVGERD